MSYCSRLLRCARNDGKWLNWSTQPETQLHPLIVKSVLLSAIRKARLHLSLQEAPLSALAKARVYPSLRGARVTRHCEEHMYIRHCEEHMYIRHCEEHMYIRHWTQCETTGYAGVSNKSIAKEAFTKS